MEYFPLFLDIRSRSCVIVGGGDIAVRKAKLLLRAQANVSIIAPDVSASMQQLIDQKKVVYIKESFSPEHIESAVLVIACTDDEVVNKKVSETANSMNIPVNVVDNPELCSFIVPSIIDRSPIIATVTSGGSSPVLARIIRSRLETMIPSNYGRLSQLAADYRDRVKERFDNIDDRRSFWEEVLQGTVAEMVLTGKDKAARDMLETMLTSAKPRETGEVYLVGGGPGDPDLLTFKALRLMQQSDVIVHDRLVSQGVLDLCRRDAEFIYVGKERDKHTVPQEGINELLVRLAKEGKRVCRLKGGDPFIFGRGGEEIETLVDENIPFQVVPGITAASGVASYSGIPLTHRDYSQSVVFVTGHLRDGTMNLNWPGLVQPNQTIVFYMGLMGVNIICEKLIEHGMDSSTPISLVQKGTTPDQKVIIGTLESMPDIIKNEEIKPPTLIIVGDVVRLHEKLNWFEK